MDCKLYASSSANPVYRVPVRHGPHLVSYLPFSVDQWSAAASYIIERKLLPYKSYTNRLEFYARLWGEPVFQLIASAYSPGGHIARAQVPFALGPVSLRCVLTRRQVSRRSPPRAAPETGQWQARLHSACESHRPPRSWLHHTDYRR